MLKSLEKKLDREYSKAYKGMQEKLTKHLDKFKDADTKMLAKKKAGEMTEKQYQQWRADQMLNTKNFKDMRDVLSQDLVNTDKIAAGIVNDHTIDIYALNRNYGSYEVCKGTGLDLSFSLYDHKTVENLITGKKAIIPKAKTDIPKDLRWSRTKITSAITQGVLSGDSIPDIAKRLQGVANMSKRAAIRNARTYTTAAENAGRVDSYEEAEDMGIEMEQEWMATVDDRTRPSHVALDGERVSVGERFSNGLRYPADPDGDPEEVYNCRCTLVAAIAGHQRDLSGRFMRLPEGETYEDWKARGKAYQSQEESKERQTESSGEPSKEMSDLSDETKANDKVNRDGLSEEVLDVIGFPDDKPIEISDIMKNTNPNFNDDSYKHSMYHSNCQRCAASYELQRRGYSVEAMPFNGEYPSISTVFNLYKYKNDDTYVNKDNDKYKISRSPKTTAETIRKAMSDWGEGSRATLSVNWRGGNTSHIVNVENIKGEITILDSQCGISYKDLEGYLSETKCAETELLRTDILSFKENIDAERLATMCRSRGQ